MCVIRARVDWIDEHYADDVCLENPGLAMLASVLRSSGCVAEVYDGNLQNMRSCADILSRLPGVAVLGLSPDSSVLPEVIAWLPEVRSKFPALAIAVGDWAASNNWEDTVRRVPEGVAVCVGEGDLPMRDWAMRGFDQAALLTLRGFAVRRTDRIHFAGPAPIVGDLDVLPFMDRQVFVRVRMPSHDTLVMMGSRLSQCMSLLFASGFHSACRCPVLAW